MVINEETPETVAGGILQLLPGLLKDPTQRQPTEFAAGGSSCTANHCRVTSGLISRSQAVSINAAPLRQIGLIRQIGNNRGCATNCSAMSMCRQR